MTLDLRTAALFLDVDGTLLELQERPEAVVSSAPLRRLLTGLQDRSLGALALVSGRPLVELDRIFSPDRFAAAGGHGAQIRLPNGSLEDAATPLPDATRQRLEQRLKSLDGVFIEAKSHGLALHYRARPEAMAQVRAAAERERSRLGQEFDLLAGKMVFELLPKNINKGRAIARLLADPLFAGRRPIFIGDDVTDEFGFSEVNARDGISIRVGSVTERTLAQQHLDDVPAVHRWLSALLEAQP